VALGDVDGVVLSVDPVVVVVVESDVDGVAVLLEVPVESLADVESLDDVSPLAFETAAPPPTVLELGLELVRMVDDVGGEPQSELCASAAGAWTAKAPNAMSATPKSPSAIAAPSAAGLISSALTVHPRFT
jgi:hypothetical protein